ncbi:MAG TPA: ABC transporter ATP-binding protein [Tepidisphaeraceae bacterium]|jgi:ABC-type dipeptide/oligopeptide/nickel transport system ATPase component|nr:ABC transporter ATP-binding protein [Tepidisphaeraceae bacterium]
MTQNGDIVLQVKDLRVSFTTILGGRTDAVRGVSFSLRRGKTLALVGESGSGKSVTSYSILRLIQKPGEITGGQVLFSPQNEPATDLLSLPPKSNRLFDIRGGKISMIFQEPMTALSPVHTIGNQLCEAILLHSPCSQREALSRAEEMLAKVGIKDPQKRLKQYPFEFSGGMRQRVVIAMALVCRPEVLIADEPTTALDVTVQAQILSLINDLQSEMNTAVLFITHDLGVVAQVADDVAVMRQGRIVESANVRDLFKRPLHPYTRRLLGATPHARRDPEIQRLLNEPFPHEDLPSGWIIDEQEPHGVEPKLHRFSDNREILLWPASPEATR